MSDGFYIKIHTKVKFWLPKKRQYTELDALISHTLDMNEGLSWSISGYAKLWQWSRTRVKNFLKNIYSNQGHHKDIHRDSKSALGRQGVVIKINDLEAKENIKKTLGVHSEDTTIKNKNKNNKDIESDSPSKESVKGVGGGGKKLVNGEVKEIVEYLNKVAGTNYKPTTGKTQQLIQARMNEGFSVDDFEKVIDVKVASWKGDDKYSKYLRPETLFGNKFEGYLNEKPLVSSTQPIDNLTSILEAYGENN